MLHMPSLSLTSLQKNIYKDEKKKRKRQVNKNKMSSVTSQPISIAD